MCTIQGLLKQARPFLRKYDKNFTPVPDQENNDGEGCEESQSDVEVRHAM